MSSSNSPDATDAQSETDARTRRAREQDIEIEHVTDTGANAVATVSNDDDTDEYGVTVTKEYTLTVGCTCRDWMFRVRRESNDIDAQKGCKHMRAVSMVLPDSDLYEVVESLVENDVDDDVIREMVDAPERDIDVTLRLTREGAVAALESLAE